MIPARQSDTTETAANKTPIKIYSIDFQNLIPNILAAKAPVHAPVPGNGIPTNTIRPAAS